jgi:hypothetical protein
VASIWIEAEGVLSLFQIKQLSMPEGGEVQVICPFCRSKDTRSNGLASQSSKISVLSSILLLGIPVLLYKKTYHCFDCGKDFRVKKSD